MVNIAERVRIIEAHMGDHSELFADLRQGLLRFEERVDRRFEQIDRRLLELEQRFETRLGALDQKIDTGLAAQSAEIAALRRDITALFTTQFRWTAGIMITGVMAIVAAILAR